MNEILSRISLQTDVVFGGEMTSAKHFSHSGYVHLVESGSLKVKSNGNQTISLDKPSILFFPTGISHSLIPASTCPVKLVSIAVNFNGFGSCLSNALPSLIHFELSADSAAASTIHILFSEVFENRFGRQVLIERLSDIFILQILREATERGIPLQGVLSAASHPQLSKVIEVIHQKPSENWTLESLANIAAMSRSKFASSFRNIIGQTPIDYITDLRLGIAQSLLKKNKSIGFVAGEVGYEHGSALARIFKKKMGMSPRQWMQSIG